jgi:hypothetical protein
MTSDDTTYIVSGLSYAIMMGFVFREVGWAGAGDLITRVVHPENPKT